MTEPQRFEIEQATMSCPKCGGAATFSRPRVSVGRPDTNMVQCPCCKDVVEVALDWAVKKGAAP